MEPLYVTITSSPCARRATVFLMSERNIDLASPELGAELLEDAKGDFPVSVWRVYVLHHGGCFQPARVIDDLPPVPTVFGWSTAPYRSTLDPQQAVDEAWKSLVHLLYTSPPHSYDELVKGIWDTQLLLFGAHSEGRMRGQPNSTMRLPAIRAYTIRKFNSGKSTVSWFKLANMLFVNDKQCSRCKLRWHHYNSACVKALRTAVDHLKLAMKNDGIPV
jgi:hypothetical protein